MARTRALRAGGLRPPQLELRVREETTPVLASHLLRTSSSSAMPGARLEIGLLFLRFRVAQINRIYGASGRKPRELFLRRP